jgi:outer membrane protein
MNTMKTKLMITAFLLMLSGLSVNAQGKIWTLQDCIKYALDKNIQIQKSGLTNDQNQLYANQAKFNRLPSVSASVNENLNWYKGFDATTGQYGNNNGSNSTNYGLNASVSLYNGDKLKIRIKQAELNLESGKYYSESVKESVGLNIVNAYLQLLYANENVKNAKKQIESTTEQLGLAKERMDIGLISLSDYLQIKSELSTEKSTLATAQSTYAIDNVTLEQLMELPVDPNFAVSSPNLDSILIATVQPNSQDIYNLALGIKPEIKNAELTKESTALNVKIAKADFLPVISVNGGLSSGYSSLTTNSNYSTQLNDKINPSLGLSLSIPIFQKKQIKTNVGIAAIGVDNAELDVVNAKNQLRKEIEQACVDVVSAQEQYNASLEQQQSTQESYDVTNEKFKVGLLNSVDFLVQKTNLITSESKLLQSKYNLLFTLKVLDYYKGIPLTL